MKLRRTHAKAVIARGSIVQTGRITDVQISSAGFVPQKREWIHRPFLLDAVGLIVAGHGTYQVGDGPVRSIGPGSVFAVYPGPVFHYGPSDGQTWSERFITVTGAGLRRWVKAGWLWQDGAVYQLDDWSAAVDLHSQLMSVLTRSERGDADRAVLVAERYLLELYYARSRPASDAQRPSHGLGAVLAYCRSHLAEPIDFAALAERYAMSYSSLRQQISRATGLPPAKYLLRLRCDAARAMLTETDLPIKAIASRVGLADAYTFSRSFKRCVGLSPEHYRREHAPWLTGGGG